MSFKKHFKEFFKYFVIAVQFCFLIPEIGFMVVVGILVVIKFPAQIWARILEFF